MVPWVIDFLADDDKDQKRAGEIDLAYLYIKPWRRDQPTFVAPFGNDTIIRTREPTVPVVAVDWGAHQ